MSRFGDLGGRVRALMDAARVEVEEHDPLCDCRLEKACRELVLEFCDIEFFFCPLTGRVIQGMEGDDKVLCGCGRTNPIVLSRTPTADETGGVAKGMSHHVKRFLAVATRLDFEGQRHKVAR